MAGMFAGAFMVPLLTPADRVKCLMQVCVRGGCEGWGVEVCVKGGGVEVCVMGGGESRGSM